MKTWKLTNGNYLIEGDPEPFPTSSVTSIPVPGGDILYQASPYFEVTGDSERIATYGIPRAFSLEDVLYIYGLHTVVEGRLCRVLWQERWGREAIVEIDSILQTGLIECPTTELPFDPVSLIAATEP